MYSINYKRNFEMQLNIPDFSVRYFNLYSSKKKNIVYIKDIFDNSTFRYRAYNVMEAMEDSNKYFVVCFLVRELYSIYSLIDNIEFVVLQRAKWSFELESFVNILKKRNVKIIYDMDDMIYHSKYVPRYLNSISDYRDFTVDSYFALAKRYEMIASLCDGFIATTDSLANNIKQDFNKPVWILPNFLNKEQESISKDIVNLKKDNYDNSKFVIGYFSGSNSHQRDLEIIESAIVKLITKYDNIYLKIVGFMSLSDTFNDLRKKGRIIIEKFVSYEELQYKIGTVDVNVIPLQKHTFNDCKSELKYFEASIVNVVTCATDNSVYSNVIVDGEDGFLCGEMDWYSKLEYIYLHYNEINCIINKARDKCYKLYGNKNQMDKITKIYDNIIESIGDMDEKK